MPRNNDKELLHPEMKGAVRELEAQLQHENIPLYIYEGARTPFRQASLWAQGRVAGVGEPGKTVTKAGPWDSLHQYCCAVDYVFRIDGQWVWLPKTDKRWELFHHLARHVGLEPLSFEFPHVQLKGVQLSDLRAGKFPPGRPGPWLEFIEHQAELWGQQRRFEIGHMHAGAPPLLFDRPAMDEDAA